ncbi:MAG: hypothetical protein V4685_17150 [Bacteroidota bacterium]
MKKFFPLMAMIVFLSSCNKEKTQVCWRCELYDIANGEQEPTQTVCTDGPQPGVFKDEDGNNLTSHCTRQ